MRHLRRFRTLVVAGLMLAVGVATGWMAHKHLGDGAELAPRWETPLAAVGAVASERFAMATGPIDDEVEGVFLLDASTGLLQCNVLSLRTTKFAAVFQRNVLQDLPGPPRRRTPRYLLSTGQISFTRTGPMARVGRSVAYVLDATTGNYAAYALRWQPELAATGRAQAGEFVLLDTGTLGGAPEDESAPNR